MARGSNGKVNDFFSVLKSKVLDCNGFLKLALFCYFAFFLSGFYVTELSSSRHGSWIKIGLLFFLVTLFCILIKSWRNKELSLFCFFREISMELRVLLLSLGGFFLYFISQSIIFGDWAPVRRVVIILLFVF